MSRHDFYPASCESWSAGSVISFLCVAFCVTFSFSSLFIVGYYCVGFLRYSSFFFITILRFLRVLVRVIFVLGRENVRLCEFDDRLKQIKRQCSSAEQQTGGETNDRPDCTRRLIVCKSHSLRKWRSTYCLKFYPSCIRFIDARLES